MPCSPGMRNCRASCAHRAFVRQYQAERMRQELVAEYESIGYETEWLAYVAEHPLVTFKSWMKDHKAPSVDAATIEPTPDDWEPPEGF